MAETRRIVAWTSLTLDGYTSGPEGPSGDGWLGYRPRTRDLGRWLDAARVNGGRLSVCRPTVHRRRWENPAFGWHPYALTLRARCDRERLVFRARDEPYLWGGRGIGHFEYGWPARAPGRGRGIATVFGGRY